MDEPLEQRTVNGFTAEQQLIGAVTFNPDLLRVASAVVTSYEFYDPRMEQCWDLITTAWAAKSPLDPGTLGIEIERKGIRGLSPADPHSWASSVWGMTEHTVSALANTVHESWVRRSMQQVIAQAQGAETGEALSQMIEGLRQLRAGSTEGVLQGKELGDLLKVPANYDWLVDGLMERGDRLMLTGAEGTGKTMFIRQMVLCLAAGLHPFALTDITPLRVLVIDAENSERQWKRAVSPMVETLLKAGTQGDPRERVHVVCSPRLDVTRESHIGAVHRKIDEIEPDLVAIGPLYKITSRAITTDDEAAPVLTALDSIRDRGLSLLIEAHAGKGMNSAGDRNLAPRGSSALLGWPEFGIGLRLDAEASSERRRVIELSRWRGDRDQRAWPDVLTTSGPLPWNDESVSASVRARLYGRGEVAA